MKQNPRHRKTNAAPRRPVSEMMWEFAGNFIRLGRTQGEKECRLVAASSAWNIACNPPAQRPRMLDRFMAEYLGYNLDTDPVNAAAIRGDMEKLVERKLKLFPMDTRQIVNARLVPMGDKDRIDVVSARVE